MRPLHELRQRHVHERTRLVERHLPFEKHAAQQPGVLREQLPRRQAAQRREVLRVRRGQPAGAGDGRGRQPAVDLPRAQRAVARAEQEAPRGAGAAGAPALVARVRLHPLLHRAVAQAHVADVQHAAILLQEGRDVPGERRGEPRLDHQVRAEHDLIHGRVELAGSLVRTRPSKLAVVEVEEAAQGGKAVDDGGDGDGLLPALHGYRRRVERKGVAVLQHLPVVRQGEADAARWHEACVGVALVQRGGRGARGKGVGLVGVLVDGGDTEEDGGCLGGLASGSALHWKGLEKRDGRGEGGRRRSAGVERRVG
eukprot:Rhum_TRINITY_DN13359_c0_g1::Rhum_TRINITY_DN13359_c0_g1_i1::g.59450::m.59450